MSWTDWFPFGNVIGGIASAFGQSSANRTNRQIADNTNYANAKQAAEQMAFQERMYDSRYQKTVEDLKKAGINPMLASSLGGGSSPAGASVSAQIGAPSQNILSGVPEAVNSAISARRTNAEIKNMSATNSKIESDTALNKALTETTKRDAMLKSASARAANAQANNLELDSVQKSINNLIDSSPQGLHLKVLNRYLDSLGNVVSTASGVRSMAPRRSIETRNTHHFDSDGVVTGGYISHSNAVR